MQPRLVQAGETIFRAGDPSSGVYVIEDGAVAITVDGIDVAVLGPGDLFGESGVLEARTRSATATALAATSLLVTDAETFLHAFGMDNDRALALVKLLCQRLRRTTQRSLSVTLPDAATVEHAAIHLLPDHPRLIDLGVEAIAVRHLPFQVGNRYGGETLPIATDRGCTIQAHGEPELAAPHFEILRRDGRLGVRDLGSRFGTIVNGVALHRGSAEVFAPMHGGDNLVVAGRAASPFRFRVTVHGSG